ncbi:MAG: YgaP family membrane protein [Patescibacteria group bacterium]
MKQQSPASVTPLFRQVFFVAAIIIVTGIYFGVTQSMYFLALPGLVAFGLIVTATTGFCPMAYFLHFLPWNTTK